MGWRADFIASVPRHAADGASEDLFGRDGTPTRAGDTGSNLCEFQGWWCSTNPMARRTTIALPATTTG